MDEGASAFADAEDDSMDTEQQGAAGGGDGGGRVLEDPYLLVQQLLCPFIELATSTQGQPAVQALRTVGKLLAEQKPLVLVNKHATWMPQLLDWLQKFLLPEDCGSESLASSDASVRGVAAAAMLDLGVCSGSLRCVLLTVSSLLANCPVGALSQSIDCQHVAASVQRLRESSTISPSSPCGGATVFVPVAYLEAPRSRQAQNANMHASALGAPRDLSVLGIPRGSTMPYDFSTAALSKAGKFISVACDGKYLYVHSPAGLTKYGTGYMATTLGHVYIHKAFLQTQRPWLACVEDKLYLRSPTMAPTCLIVVDTLTLEQVGLVNPCTPAESVSLHTDGSAKAMFPEKGTRTGEAGSAGGGGPGGGGAPGGRPDRPSWTVGSRPSAGMGDSLGVASSEMELDALEDGEEAFHELVESERQSTAHHDFLQQYRRAALSEPSRRQSAGPVLSSSLDHIAVSRGAGRTPVLYPGGSRSAHGLDPHAPHGGLDPDGLTHAELAAGSSGVQRSPVISDGRYLHIIAKSDKARQTPTPPSRIHPTEVRDEDDESSEGGGQIGSTWDKMNFCIETFDPQDGMRHVRSVSIQGPVSDYGLQEGEGMLSCCVCGLVMRSNTPAYRCQVCNPEYDLCNHCYMRGACSQGHREHHQMRPMDHLGPHDHEAPGADHVYLAAFPAKCLDYQSFYTDGKFLMVLVPPELSQGCKIPGFLCRVFDIVEGNHLYDISLGDCQEDPRNKDLGKLPSGGSCYDPINDLVWNLDIDGFKVRRWRHPWTSPLLNASAADAQVLMSDSEVSGAHLSASGLLTSKRPVQDAMRAILACLYNAAEKHARCVMEPGVMEPCHETHHTWVPFCIESLPSTFTCISSIVDACIKQDTMWTAAKIARASEAPALENRPLNLELLRTCMRLVVVNIGRYGALKEEDKNVQLSASLTNLKQNILLIAESKHDAQAMSDELLLSTIAEANSALTSGLDIFFPSADEQASLLIQLLKNAQGKEGEQQKLGTFEILASEVFVNKNAEGKEQPLPHQQVLSALAIHLSKPSASNLVFSIFDGRWLAHSQERVALAQELLLLLLDRARSSGQSQAAEEDAQDAQIRSRGHSDTELGTQCHLLNLMAAFQRHLLSIPLSSNRSNSQSEALLLLFARHLFDYSLATFKDLVDKEGVHDLAAPFIRVLVPPLATALADNSWSQNVSTSLEADILPRLHPLMAMLDQLNSKLQSVQMEDAVFSNKGTEARFIGGRIVSIARGKASKALTRVHIPGASHMLVRITEDVTLTKKEQLKVSWEPREILGGRDKSELIIKGSQRGKRIWRSFRCPADTITLHYSITERGRGGAGAEDLKGFRNIRFAVYGCARNNPLQMPLNWLLDVELTLASLTAKFMWTSLHRVPAPPSLEAAPWVTGCPLFSGGFDHEWLLVHCPQLVPALSQREQQTLSTHDQANSAPTPEVSAEVLHAVSWSSEAFTAFISDHLKRHVRTPDWLSHSFFCTRAQQVVSVLIKAAGLVRVADEFGLTWKTEAQMPHHLQIALTSTMRIIQGLIMDMRKKMQQSVSLSCAQDPSPPDAMELVEDGDGGAAQRPAPEVEASSESVDSVKRAMSQLAEEKGKQMMLRAALLMATFFDNDEGMGCCVAAAKHLKSGEQGRFGLCSHPTLDQAALVQCGIDLASRFLTADVHASEMVGVAAQSLRLIEERKSILQNMTRLLQTISLSSVRQLLISTFIAGPSPVESQRTLVRFSALGNLFICTHQSIQSVQEDVAKFFTFLASTIDNWVGNKLTNRSHVAMTHLILSAYHSLHLHPGDGEWLLNAGILPKLSNLMVDSSGHMMGASPEQLLDAVEHDSLAAVREAAFAVFSSMTSTLARMAAAQGAAQDGHLTTLLESAVQIAAVVVKGIALHPANETRDLLQLQVLTWLHGLASLHHPISRLIVHTQQVRLAIMDWALEAHSPQVQRVAIRLLASVLCNDDVNSSCQTSISEKMRDEWLQTSNGEHLVQRMLASMGAVFGAQGAEHSNAEHTTVPKEGDVKMRDRVPRADAPPPYSGGKEHQWMVMVWPSAPDTKLDSKAQAQVEETCKASLQEVRRYQDTCGTVTASRDADAKAKQVAASVAKRDKACAFVGTYQDCQLISWQWDSSHSIALVLKSGLSRQADMPRWRSGHVAYSVALQQLGLLAALHRSCSLGRSVAVQLVRALTLAATHWEQLVCSPALHLTPELQLDICKGLAVVETICGKSHVFARVGSHVTLKQPGSSGRNSSRGGVIVGCDHLMGSMSVLPHMVLSSKSLQSIVPTIVPLTGGQGLVSVDTQVDTAFVLSKEDAPAVMSCLVKMSQHLQDVLHLQSSGVSGLSRWCRVMQSRALCALSHMLQHSMIDVREMIGSGMLTALVDHAIENPTCHDVDALEMRRAIVASALCESSYKAPTALLGAARAPGSGGGGGGAGSGGPDAPPGGAGGGAGGRAHRMMPSVESFIRTSRATQRQDQRRQREILAAELAEITRHPVRLCILALERENGNQDRAGNWLFDQGETFLAEHPEFAEVPESAGEGGAGAGAGEAPATETPLFLLYDAFSYYEDMQARVFGGEDDSGASMGAVSALAAGVEQLPAGMIDELRAHGQLPSDDMSMRTYAYDERMLGGQPTLVFGRPRGPLAHLAGLPVRTDETVRAGHFATLNEMDVLSDVSFPHGKQMVGKTVYVESIDRTSEGQQAKITWYDCATATVKTITVPAPHLEKAVHPGGVADCDLGSEDAQIKASVEVDGKLTSVYARACLCAMLEAWPQDVVFDETSLGGRHRLIPLAQAAALGSCCNLTDIPKPVWAVAKLQASSQEASSPCHQAPSLSTLLMRRLSTLLSQQLIGDELLRDELVQDAIHQAPVMQSPAAKLKRDREMAIAQKSSADEVEAANGTRDNGARDKRRRFGKDTSEDVSSMPSQDTEFLKSRVVEQPAIPLIHFLADECLLSVRAALTCQTTVEHASDHPYVRTGSNTGANSRRCLQLDACWALMVVFDSRCTLLPGESLRFFSDAACTQMVASAAMDDRRKGLLPLVLPSPVWMQIVSTGQHGNDDGEHNWGFRLEAFPLGEPTLALAFWLSQLVVPLRHKSTLSILEAVLDVVDKSDKLAAPHSIQAHRLAMDMMQQLVPGVESTTLLRDHACFAKMTHEATLRQQWESKQASSAARQPGESTRCPHSTYLCSMAEMLASRALAIRKLACDQDSLCIQIDSASMPAWLKGLDKAMSILGCMYRGKQRQLETFIDEACTLFKSDSLTSAQTVKQAASMLQGGQLSGAARDALSELFHLEPDAVTQVARLVRPVQQAAHNKRDFLLQAQALLMQDETHDECNMSDLMQSFGLDRLLVRWGPDRDGDLVMLVNMLTETEQGLISPLDQSMVGKMKLKEYHQRKVPRLGAVPELALKRRLMLLKLLNQNLDKCLVTIDFSRRTCSSSFAASVCELQHLLFHQTKATLHNAVIEWTTCPQPRAGSSATMLTREVLIHRPARCARDNQEKAEHHERWRLVISLPPSGGDSLDQRNGSKLEEFLVAPADFGGARQMAADAAVSASLVLADPPNGSLPLRNTKEVRGNIALIERGGGQFVNVVRRAQQAGAIGVVMADSKEGPLFLMSTELGNSGDEVTIPAVLLSLSDSMLLLMRQHPVMATISGDGVLMQTYRQLRYVASVRLRQRDEMGWRVKFQGEGHHGYQGPYREAMSALCAELQSPQLQLFVPCANAVGLVGDNRDKFVPRPSACSDELLDTFYFVGQLMGVAMRTRNLLNLDLPSMVWKSLIGMELDEEDLKAIDFSCWNATQFRDHDGQAITATMFEELLHDVRFTCCLTDGCEVALLPDGSSIPVTYQRRDEYARLVMKARLCESESQLSKMRCGLCSVIPEQLLGFMTWEELERRVCGSPEVDISSLKRHTQYRQGVDKNSPHIKMFWEVLESFCQADRRLFLRFAYDPCPLTFRLYLVLHFCHFSSLSPHSCPWTIIIVCLLLFLAPQFTVLSS